MAERNLNLIAAGRSLAARWRLLAAVGAVTMAVALAVNFLLLPKWYRSTTIIMPPQEKSSFTGLGMLLSQVSNMPGGLSRLASGIVNANPSQYLFVVILNSRTVADSLIDKYDLQRVYGLQYRFQARRVLAGHTTIDFPPEGHLVITVEAEEDPELARDLAREYVVQLNNVLRERGLFATSGRRKFLEERLAEYKTGLAALEDSLRSFQAEFKIIEPTEQAKGLINLLGAPVEETVKVLGELQAEREMKQVELGLKESIFTGRHPQVSMLRREIAEIDRSIARIKRDFDLESYRDGSQLNIPLEDLPQVMLDYARLFRAVKIHDEMYTLLSAQYEEARINEADDTPNAIVLDPAELPEYKFRPKRLLNAAIATAAAMLLTALLILGQARLREALERE